MSSINKVILISIFVLASCQDDARIVSSNLSKAAANFEIDRRVVFFNGITDKYLLTIEGKCDIVNDGRNLKVTCKTDSSTFVKHYLGLSDNVSYFVEQINAKNASRYNYRVTFKPEAIKPYIDLRIKE